MARWCREHASAFLRARDFLAAPFLLRKRWVWWVSPKGRVPWSHGAFLWRRRPGHRRSFVARAGQGAVQQNGRRGRAPCGADELGDAVEPLFIDIIDWAVAQELVCRDERSSSLHGRAGRAG